MIGKTISHYKIIENIGSGGMGIVYKAQDLKLDRFVALKFLPPHLTSSDDEKQRFIHEAKAASALQHNNICAIHEIDETDDAQIFICMDYYEGETLDKRIKEKPLPIEEAINIAIQIAQGLTKAHEKEIVHRDIKPANIMLTKEGLVKVLDFGLAKLSTQTKLTKESTTLGTISYMSPEQAKGEEVDYRTDIWSLGVILYEMLTGQLPFKGEYESAVIYSILNDTQEPVTALRTGMPMELERIINKCLQKNPAERYQHIDELIVDLKGLKGQSDTVTIPSKDEKQKRRSKLVLIPMAILSILILIVVGYFLLHPGEKSGSGWESSIAVLPFADLSPDKDQEYFCDGMTEQIITNLSKINRLKVIARTSVMSYKNTDKQIPEIGKELNVAYILEGSIRKYGNSIRVTAQLINTEDGSHLWADDFDRELEHVFEVQDDVSEAIATNLLANLSLEEITKIKSNRPSNTEAYEYYMNGRYFHYNKFLRTAQNEDFCTAERMLKKAIELDSNFADSYASLVDLYNTYYYYSANTSAEKEKYMQLQEAYLDTAYQLDPNSAEVNYAKGTMHDAKNEDDEAFKSYKIAIKINPNIAQYYREMGAFLNQKGCAKLAIQCYDRAIDLNPLSPIYYIDRGVIYHHIGEYTKAESDFKKALEINPAYELSHYGLFLLLVEMKRNDEANSLFAQMENIFPAQKLKYVHAYQYAIKGQKEKALNTIKSEHWNMRVHIYTLLNMNNEVISILYERTERYNKAKDSKYFLLKNVFIFDNLRSNPRFQEILAKHKKIYEENLAKYGDIDI